MVFIRVRLFADGLSAQIQDAPNAFAGAAFHCYSGDVSEQDTFHNAEPSKEIYFTECTGSYGSDWWSDIKWYMDNLFIGATQHNAMAVLMYVRVFCGWIALRCISLVLFRWNLALDGNGQPETPGSNSCTNPPCRPIGECQTQLYPRFTDLGGATVTISGSNYSYNQECTSTNCFGRENRIC
jgi:hypothetical protein